MVECRVVDCTPRNQLVIDSKEAFVQVYFFDVNHYLVVPCVWCIRRCRLLLRHVVMCFRADRSAKLAVTDKSVGV